MFDTCILYVPGYQSVAIINFQTYAYFLFVLLIFQFLFIVMCEILVNHCYHIFEISYLLQHLFTLIVTIS